MVFHPMCGTWIPAASSNRPTTPGMNPSPPQPPSSALSSNSTCMPMHIPKKLPLPSAAPARYARSASSYPLPRNASMAWPNAPTPGKTSLSARSMSAIDPTSLMVYPSLVMAFLMERMFPAP